MDREPLVSVVVPFFNAEPFLDEAVQSVFAQSYDHWELLLVDDGSTDGSTEVALTLARSAGHRVRYLQHAGHRNCGSSAARNLGARHAMGEFLAFLDSDDVWQSRKLEQQIEMMLARPEAGMVYGRTEYWYSWTGKAEDRARDVVMPLGVEGDSLVRPPLLLAYGLEGKAAAPSASNAVVRRCVFDAVKGFETRFRGMYDDQAFFAKVCLRHPVYVSTEVWDRYRQHSGSCCSVSERSGRHPFERQRYLKWLERYLAAQSAPDPELWTALKNKQRKFCRPALQNWLAWMRSS